MCDKKISVCINLHSFFKSIANSFVSLFVPIIVYTQTNFNYTMIFLFVLFLSISILNLCFYKLIKKNPILCIGLSFISYLLLYIILSTTKLNLLFIICLAILNGVGNVLYYVPIQTIVSQNKNSYNFSYFQIYKTIGVIIITFINGYILNLKSSFSILITCLISMIFFILSYIPFFLIKKDLKIENKGNITLQHALKSLKKYHYFNILFGIQNFIVSMIIPLYLIINNLSIKSFAYLVIIINLLKIFVNLISNYMYNNKKSMIIIFIGCCLFIISCFVVGLSNNKIVLYIFSIIPSITFPMFYLTTFKEYTKVSEEFIVEALIIREIFVHIFNILFLIPMFIISDLKIIIFSGVLISILMFFSAFCYFKK